VIVLGIDSGSTSVGWCRLRASGGGMGRAIRLAYLAGGKCDATPAAILALVDGAQGEAGAPRAELVAIERVEGGLFRRRGRRAAPASQLFATSHVAGGIAWMLDVAGVGVVVQPATWWRRIVLGRGSASDRSIRVVVPRLVDDWPERSSVHVRDAAGVAIAAVWTRRGRAA